METAEEFIQHYGTRGMKWGVRKNIQSRQGAARSEYVEAKDAKWVGKVSANPKISKVTRIAARDAKKQTRKLKKEYKENGLNVKKPGLARTRYDNEVKDILQQSVDRASNKIHGTSPTGLKEVQIFRYADGSMTATIGTRDNLKIRKQQRQIAKADVRAAKAAAKVKHADIDPDAPTADDYDGFEFRLVLDDEGFVDDILTPFDDEVEHSDDDIVEYLDEEVIQHYGVKGMQWGVRRSSSGGSSSASPAPVRKSRPAWQNPPSKKIATVPAKKLSRSEKRKLKKQPKPLSPDALQFQALKAKVKKEGLGSLNNAEVKAINTRFELEKKFKDAYPKKPSLAAQLFLNDTLFDMGSTKAVAVASAKFPLKAGQIGTSAVIAKELRKTLRKG